MTDDKHVHIPIETEQGNHAVIYADQDVSKETVEALKRVVDAAVKWVQEKQEGERDD